MNREELEKMFDEKFNVNSNSKIYDHYNFDNPKPHQIKDFIIEEIIPEVLKSIIKEDIFDTDDFHKDIQWGIKYNIQNIKQKAKELYGIDL